ncbi:MAG TPA: hypothetical protein VMM76_00785 [Pirellulaceae bacterium]|nr:hypothetical protein [Pirellulaceae bacterium]
MDINSWVRCKSGARVADNAPVIIVEQDINSLNEELNTRRFDGQQLEGFVSMACQEADGILKLYFPQ